MDELRWFIEYERAREDFARDGDVDEFRRDLRRLGFTYAEVSEEIERDGAGLTR